MVPVGTGGGVIGEGGRRGALAAAADATPARDLATFRPDPPRPPPRPRHRHGRGAANGHRRPPENMKTAIVLRYFADLSVKDVAAELRVPEATVKTLTRRAIERLRVAGLGDIEVHDD